MSKRRSTGRIWSPAEDISLMEYRSMGFTYAECGEMLCRTASSCENRAGKLGIRSEANYPVNLQNYYLGKKKKTVVYTQAPSVVIPMASIDEWSGEYVSLRPLWTSV